MGEIVPVIKQAPDTSQAVTLLGSTPLSQADYEERIRGVSYRRGKSHEQVNVKSKLTGAPRIGSYRRKSWRPN